MYKYGDRSESSISTCTDFIQRVFRKTLELFDHSALEGHRGKIKQDHYYDTHKSKLKYPNGKHNSIPSMALDAVPYPVYWVSKRDILNEFSPEEGFK